MSYFPRAVISEIESRVTIYYVDIEAVRAWNMRRPEGSLRLLTGWVWIEKRGERRHRGGFKTLSVARRDAYYTVVMGASEVPGETYRIRLARAA